MGTMNTDEEVEAWGLSRVIAFISRVPASKTDPGESIDIIYCKELAHTIVGSGKSVGQPGRLQTRAGLLYYSLEAELLLLQ